MTDHEITLPPLPNRALRPGAGDDAMQDYARAAVLLDRQQRAAPSAEPVITDAQVAAAERELWMGGMRDVPSEVVRLALSAALEEKR
jgi:hypothetical protein